MIIHAPRCALRLFENRQALILLVVLLTLMLAPGMRGRPSCARELTDGLPVGAPSPISVHLQAPRFVHLEPGSRLEGQSAPQGWSHLVIKSIPKLATGDLDTVSSQAFETARRIRPVDRGRHQANGAEARIELLPFAGGSGYLCSRRGQRQ